MPFAKYQKAIFTLHFISHPVLYLFIYLFISISDVCLYCIQPQKITHCSISVVKHLKNHNTAGILRGPNCFTEYTRYPNENVPKLKPFFSLEAMVFYFSYTLSLDENISSFLSSHQFFYFQYGHSGECLRQGFSHTTTGYLSVDRVRFWRF